MNLERARALAVLGIKPSTFHSLHYGGKTKKLQKLLEKALIERTEDFHQRTEEEMKAEFNINFTVADLSTIHEAFQFLMKKYVEEEAPDINFLTLEDNLQTVGFKSNFPLIITHVKWKLANFRMLDLS